MMRYGLLINGKLENVIESDTAPGAPWVPCGDAGPGWIDEGDGAFTAPPAPVDPYEWLIDIGPYMDRFGTNKMAVLTGADVGIKAIIQDMMARKYIDLTRADVAQGLTHIGSVVTEVTPALQTAIRTTPVAMSENVWLRNTKVFG